MKLFTSVVGENQTVKEARKLVVYHIFIDRFAIQGKSSFKHAVLLSHLESPGKIKFFQNKKTASNENKPNFCGGNILGIVDSLDYLVDYLGVNAIWLSPFNTGFSFFFSTKFHIEQLITDTISLISTMLVKNLER